MSRTRRFKRLRRTAVRPYLGTTIATRNWPPGESMRLMSNKRTRTRSPVRISRSISIVLVIRRERPKPKVGSGAGVLAWQFDREALATLFPSPAQHLASPFGFHARAESVCPDPALVAGAVRWLAHSC